MTGKNRRPRTKAVPLSAHLSELRRRIIYALVVFIAAFALCFVYAQDIFQFLAAPLRDQLILRGDNPGLIYTALTEVFFSYVKIALYGGAFLAFPFIAIQIWIFIAPGLYRQEKNAMLPFLTATPILFACGGAFAYFILFPLAWNFFLGFEMPDATSSIQLVAKVDSYLDLSLQLMFAFAVAFELPVLITLLHRAKLVSLDRLRHWRKFAVIGAFIVAAVLTPPDIISQIALAIPMILLYEMSLLFIRWTAARGAARGQKRH